MCSVPASRRLGLTRVPAPKEWVQTVRKILVSNPEIADRSFRASRDGEDGGRKEQLSSPDTFRTCLRASGQELVDFFFSSRSRHTRLTCDWSSDVCSSD